MADIRDQISPVSRAHGHRSQPPGLSAHVDTFVRHHLPPAKSWPEMQVHGIPDLDYPVMLNAASELLDNHIASGAGPRACFLTDNGTWTYQQLLDHANRVANLLVSEGLVPGDRVLLRDANTPMLAACWFAVLKAGGIAVTTMPQLRAQELAAIAIKARVRYALCANEYICELEKTQQAASVLEKVIGYDHAEGRELPPLL